MKTSALLTFTIIFSGIVNGQSIDSLIQQRIRGQQYNFVARSAESLTMTNPVNSGIIGLKVLPDSVVADLPYFGRSFAVGHTQPDNDIKFVSTDFKYEAIPKKKGKWEINIVAKDAKGVRFILVVFNDGSAEMDVISPGREAMTYKGYVW